MRICRTPADQAAVTLFYLGKCNLRSTEVPFSKAPPATPPCITVGLYEGGAVNRSSRSRKLGGWCEMKAIWEDDGALLGTH